MTRRKFFTLAGLGLASVVGGTAFAQKIQRDVALTSHVLPIPGAGGLKIAQISDIHIGHGTPQDRITQALEICNLIQPDLVVMTGDYLNHSTHHLDRLDQFLAQLPTPCIATLGNHDHWSGPAEIQETLESHGVRVLKNESTVFELGNRSLPIVGVDDGFTRRADVEKAFAGVSDPHRALALAHYPNTADQISEKGAPFILSGHTHGGQIYIPKVTQALAATIGNRYLAGWYQVGNSRLYVNTGVGSGPTRYRVGERARPEVALFECVEPTAKVTSIVS